MSAQAVAEVERPTQLDVARAVGLAYTSIPPPVVKRTCLVDSGVATNADTGRVVAKFAVDGGPGDDSDLRDRHGTSMAMYMAAEHNGSGMVGIWPTGAVVSYRATRSGRDVRFADYAQAISACAELEDVAVISLSIVESGAPSEQEKLRLDDVMTDARNQGAVVVAAAGNDGGAVGMPGADPAVLTIAASDPAGWYCWFASRGPEVDVRAPGCDLDGASPFGLEPVFPEGSSYAAAMTAQALAALRSYRPELSVGEVEAALAEMGPVLNIEHLFHNAGLGYILDNGRALAPPEGARSVTTTARFARPSLASFRSVRRCGPAREFIRRGCRVSRRPYRATNGRLVVRVRKLPRNALLELRVFRRSATTKALSLAARKARGSPVVRVEAPRRWSALAVRFVPMDGVDTLRSSTVHVRR